MGGQAGIAIGGAVATELQGDGTPHRHGFVAFSNIFQYSSLDHIADNLVNNIHNCTGNEMLTRITKFIEH
eukprot:5342685-Karenia_brevis.AAC.1